MRVASEMAIESAESRPAKDQLARVLLGFRLRDTAFRLLALASAWGVLILLGGVIVSLIAGSMPAIKAFGLSFLWTEAWNPVTEQFGAVAPHFCSSTLSRPSLRHSPMCPCSQASSAARLMGSVS